MCEVHIAAVIAETLKAQGLYGTGCGPFAILSPNIVRDETNPNTDDQTDQVFR